MAIFTKSDNSTKVQKAIEAARSGLAGVQQDIAAKEAAIRQATAAGKDTSALFEAVAALKGNEQSREKIIAELEAELSDAQVREAQAARAAELDGAEKLVRATFDGFEKALTAAVQAAVDLEAQIFEIEQGLVELRQSRPAGLMVGGPVEFSAHRLGIAIGQGRTMYGTGSGAIEKLGGELLSSLRSNLGVSLREIDRARSANGQEVA